MKLEFSKKLETILLPFRNEYRSVVNSWIQSRNFYATYPALLVETYHYVKHSCALMSHACSLLTPDQVEIQKYFASHSAEEVGHDEWILNDLTQLGFDTLQVKNSPPLPETMNLIGSQLYVINYIDPVGLIGYIYVMESNPPSRKSLEFFVRDLGIDPKALSFLQTHGEFDLEHQKELANVLDNLIDEGVSQESVIQSAVIGHSNINALLRRISTGAYASYLPLVTT